MNISFLKDDPTNAVIVDSADKKPLYEVETPSKLSGRTTTIRRSTSVGDGQMVAQIYWHSWSSDKINFMGTEMRMDAFLRKSGGIMSNSKILTGTDGREYEWKQHASTNFSLIDTQTKVTIAQSHYRKIGLFTQPRKMNIDILPQGIPNIDVVVVSFVVMEEKHRELLAAAAST